MSHPGGRLDERTLAEAGRAERSIEALIVESDRRGVTATELAGILRDYADDLEREDRVPAGWGDD